MSTKKNGQKSRVYWKNGRAYGDFRNLGGKREALIPSGDTLATTDADVAAKLAADRVTELTTQKREGAILGLKGRATLGPFASEHLVWKAKTDVTDKTVATAERHLNMAVEFFGASRWLDSIRVRDIEAFRDALAETKTNRKRPPSGGTMRHVLNDLSNLYRHAAAKELVLPGFNPVAAMMNKPTANTEEAFWLEVPDAALLLESARTWAPGRPDISHRDMYPILATFLLTGGRKSEVLGLAVTDINFERGTVTFRPNEFRRLKTETSHRVAPLWPQLRTILRDYLFGRENPSEGLLFPSPRGEGMITDITKALDRVAMRVGWSGGEITAKPLRHTYCSARLQTLDRGAPVADWTVGRELGHGGHALVRKVYGHLGEIRHRSEVVEYRVEQHREALGDRLAKLKA